MHNTSIKTLLLFMVAFIMVALAVPLSIIINRQVFEINSLHKEKIGTDIVSKLQPINVLLAQHRGTANRFLNGNKTVLPKLNTLEQKLDSMFDTVIADCDSLNVSNDKLKLIKVNWNDLKNSYPILSPENSFKRHIDLMAGIVNSK